MSVTLSTHWKIVSWRNMSAYGVWPIALMPSVPIRAKPPQKLQKLSIPGIPTSLEARTFSSKPAHHNITRLTPMRNSFCVFGLNVDVTHHNVLIAGIGKRREPRIAAHLGAQVRRNRDCRLWDAVSREALVVVADAVINADVAVVDVVRL